MELENGNESKKLKESESVESYSQSEQQVALEDEIKILDAEKKTGTMFQGFFGIVNVIIGGGCLVLPWVQICSLNPLFSLFVLTTRLFSKADLCWVFL